MKRNEYTLRVCFESNQSELLYQGESWYRDKMSDRLNICRDMIEIIFCRSAKIEPEKYLLTDANPVRYQLYRAACFYLAVTGSLPPISSVVICHEGQEFPVDEQEKLTKGWKNCRIDVMMDAAVAARCFEKDGKRAYIALTYFLKAQLDKFPHDGFRAAWSGLNALYDGLVEKNAREKEKLKALKKLMQNGRMTCAEEFVQRLGDEFWKKLQWYNYITIHGKEAVEKDVFVGDVYNDAVLYEYLTNYICGLLEKGQPEMAQRYRQLKKKKCGKKAVCVNQQVCFLVCEYCYMLRNRSFHADKPYPIFGLADDNGDGMDGKITHLLLAVIKDVMAIQFGK